MRPIGARGLPCELPPTDGRVSRPGVLQPGPKYNPKYSPKHSPKPDILQLYGQAKHTLKSTCITGILGAEAAYMMESVIEFIDATDDLAFQVARCITLEEFQ